MANKHRGEVAFDLEGKTYTLRLSTNALCELENVLGCGINEIGSKLANPETLRLSTVRAVIWAALRDHHREVTLADAGVMVDALKLSGAVELIGKTLSAAFPDAEEGATENPPQPGQSPVVGTGKSYSANGASNADRTLRSGAQLPEKSSASSQERRLI